MSADETTEPASAAAWSDFAEVHVAHGSIPVSGLAQGIPEDAAQAIAQGQAAALVSIAISLGDVVSRLDAIVAELQWRPESRDRDTEADQAASPWRDDDGSRWAGVPDA